MRKAGIRKEVQTLDSRCSTAQGTRKEQLVAATLEIQNLDMLKIWKGVRQVEVNQ